MKRSKAVISSLLSRVRAHPIYAGLIGLGVLLVLGLPWFFVPKTVAFSYAERTCVKELTLLPSIQREATDTSYQVSFEGERTVGGWPLMATSVCFTPTEMPNQGDVTIATGPWGTWLPPQVYTLAVGAEPTVDVSALKQPVPTTKPVEVALDQPDELHAYTLVVANKTANCTDEDVELSCDISKLKLAQGKSYDYQLMKQFEDDSQEEVNTGTLKTLRAVKVTDTDIDKNQTVYGKPRSFAVSLDKAITAAELTLKGGDKTYDLDVSVKDKKITAKLDTDLPRETKYTLTLKSVDAVDGSTLVDAYKLPFTVSGGPKVTGISIPNSKVDPSAQAIVTFDQPLSDKQDITKLVSFKGGSASVAKLNATQVSVQLGDLGRCVPFTISVASGVLSKWDIKNASGWKFDSRTVCYTTSVYGYSAQGRALIAYQFGNSGPVTLYTGAIHGNEISSMYMMQSWIAELEANPDKIGNRQIVVIPNINPDGVAAGTRNNSNNVNLSRNFPTSNWVSDINDTNGRVKGGGGDKPLSEPEAAALASYTSALSPRLLLSYHAVGSLVVGDPGFSGQKAAQYAGMVGYTNATGAGGTFDYDITGSYEEWAPQKAGVPAMVIELGSYSYHNFAHHRSAMWAMLD